MLLLLLPSLLLHLYCRYKLGYKLSKPSAAPGVLPGTLSTRAAARVKADVTAKAVTQGVTRQRGVFAQGTGAPDSGLLTVLAKARTAVLERSGSSVRGMAAVHRALLAADENSDGLVTLGEFKQAMVSVYTALANY
jgi:uncharacterized protein with beta-barrel porin domain